MRRLGSTNAARLIYSIAALMIFAAAAVAQDARGTGRDGGQSIWQQIDESGLNASSRRTIVPRHYKVFRVDGKGLDDALNQAPIEFSRAAQSQRVVLEIPTPDGKLQRFRIEESPVLAPEVAAEFPDWKTYQGYGIDDPTATARFDVTPSGFHAQILSSGGTYLIDPYSENDQENHIVYLKRDLPRAAKPFHCEFDERLHDDGTSAATPAAAPAFVTRPQIRTYRLAVAATGEYTNYFRQSGDTDAQAQQRALNAIVVTVNRVIGIYRRDLALSFQLVSNTNLVFPNPATDPYANTSGDLNANQLTIDSVIGNANYDIGHLVGTGGGGVAQLAVPCRSGSKARGLTGSSNPVGDAFDVDYVAHEIGHQVGANHTFNAGGNGNCSGGNRRSTTAYEPGSAVTVMGYAGICSAANLASNSIDTFHIISQTEAINYTSIGTGSTCGTLSGANNVPVVSPLTNYTIPDNTPFVLTADASDADGDSLTYSWEQYDLGSASVYPNDPDDDDDDTTNQNRPLTRVYSPRAENFRFFPSLPFILNYSNEAPIRLGNFVTGEDLPSVARTMNFRVAVRDNRGGSSDGAMQLNVVNTATPFRVTSFNSAATVEGNSPQTVTWDVGGTDGNGINTASVNILFSNDGGQTFPLTLAAGTPNDGSQFVTLPNTATDAARIKIEAVGNVFFDINDANFTIVPGNACPTITVDPATLPNGTIGAPYSQTFTAGGANGPFAFAVTEGALPAGLTLDSATGVIGGTPTVAGAFSFTVTATQTSSGCSGSRAYTITIATGGTTTSGLQYYPLARPVRLLDTRAGQPACDTPGSPLTGGTPRTQQARTTCDGQTIPQNAQVIVGNATVVNDAAGGTGFVTLYPTGTTRPAVSNVNYVAGQVVPNSFTVRLGANGAFDIYAPSGIDFIVDITGYYAPPSTGGLYYHPLATPVRLLDTRAGEPACDSPGAPLTGGTSRTQQARTTCGGQVIPQGALAIVGNATVVNNTSGTGFVTLYPTGTTRPAPSNLNYVAGQTVPNSFSVRLGDDGAFDIYSVAGVEFIVDITGYYSAEAATDANGEAGLLYYPLATPVRLLDTRAGQPACDTPGAPLTGGTSRTQPARVTCGGQTIPQEARAVVGNATAVNNIGGGVGFVTLYPTGTTRPAPSNLNYVGGQTTANSFAVRLGAGGAFDIYTVATLDFIVDLTGFFAP